MLQRYRARRQHIKNLWPSELEPTLMRRMWADRNKSPFELLGEAWRAALTTVAQAVEDFTRGFNNKREQ